MSQIAPSGPFAYSSLVKTIGKYVGKQKARAELGKVYASLGLETGTQLTSENFEKAMGALADSLGREVGEAMANAVITDKLEIKPEDVGRFYQSFHRIRRQLLERQRQAETLNEERSRLKELYENMSMSLPIGLWSVNMGLVVTTWNRAMEELTGVNSTKAVGRRGPDIMPEYAPLMDEALNMITVIRERRFPRMLPDGSRQIESVIISPLVDRYEAPKGLVISVQDVTDIVEMEANISRADKLASVGRLAAGVAHEVGNPLTSISALVQELAGEEGKDEKFRKESLELVYGHIKRISAILNSLVDYSRKQDISFTASSIRDIIDKSVPLLKLDDRGSNINVTVKTEDDIPDVHCDPGQIQQVLVNLLLNSADAMNGNGEIIVEARNASPNTVEVSVSDQGHGMSDEVARQALVPFFTTKQVGKGTGLGLYVCYNILENHASSLEFDTAPGAGATASFRLKKAES